MPRTWQPSTDVTGVTAAGRRAAAHLLSQLCFVRPGGTVPPAGEALACSLQSCALQLCRVHALRAARLLRTVAAGRVVPQIPASSI